MLSKTLKQVDKAEAKAKKLLADAQQQAAQIVSDAAGQAKQITSDAEAKAKQEAKDAMDAAQAAGEKTKSDYAASLEAELAAQKAQALEKKDAVVQEIIDALIA